MKALTFMQAAAIPAGWVNGQTLYVVMHMPKYQWRQDCTAVIWFTHAGGPRAALRKYREAHESYERGRYQAPIARLVVPGESHTV